MKNINEYESAEAFYKEYTEGAIYDQQDVELSLEKPALLVVDMLNDFCTPGGVMYMEKAAETYEPIQNLLKAFRETNNCIIFIKDQHRADQYDSEFDKRPKHCIEGTWGANVIDELAPEKGEMELIKRRFSGFYQTDLDLVLRERDIKTLVVTGVMTNVCVAATAQDGFFRNYNIIVPTDTCRANSFREQESTLYNITQNVGLTPTSDEVIKALTK
ncbi:MAG: cysteine hydrolase [Clostridiaceae bacterium]|nr:cysteine hydrolase [Clostridiaceae bacterium]